MIRLRLGADDMARIHFAFAPMWELVMSVRALATPGADRFHGPWRRAVADDLRSSDVDVGLLAALVRPAGYIPDFLVPSPRPGRSALAAGLAQVAAADPVDVAHQLEHLATHQRAQAGPGRRERVALLRRLAASPEQTIAVVVAELERYWQVAIAPFWPRIEALLHADLAHRLDQLSTGGIHQLFAALHPLVTLTGQEIRVVKYYDGVAEADGRGLLLVPSVFAWPDVVVSTAQPHTPTVTYSPRGMGRLWDRQPTAGSATLAEVVGRTRAALLTQLDLPASTTHLADHLDLSAPTVNGHLKALTAARILSARRDGRTVLYARTELGDALVEGTQAE